MRHIIVPRPTFLTLLGGGPVDPSDLNAVLTRAPKLVAADGGADTALDAGYMPDAVIGDMDSISQAARGQIPSEKQHLIAEQTSTDFEKCLRHIEAELILALGFAGGRLDHQLAALTVLVRYPDKRCILLAKEDVCFLAPRQVSLSLPVGTRLSLFPMGPTRGKSQGLKYPIDNLRMSPSSRIGTSNEVIGPVEMQFENRRMLVLLPREHLQAAIELLCTAEPV